MHLLGSAGGQGCKGAQPRGPKCVHPNVQTRPCTPIVRPRESDGITHGVTPDFDAVRIVEFVRLEGTHEDKLEVPTKKAYAGLAKLMHERLKGHRQYFTFMMVWPEYKLGAKQTHHSRPNARYIIWR